MRSAIRPNRALVNKALGIFLDEMVSYVMREVEEVAGKPVDAAAIEVFGENVDRQFLQDLGGYRANSVARHQALSRISLTVEFLWPMFKKTLRNRSVTAGALKQIQYAAVIGADRGRISIVGTRSNVSITCRRS